MGVWGGGGGGGGGEIMFEILHFTECGFTFSSNQDNLL